MSENQGDAMSEDAKFAEQIATRLRGPEHVNPSFEKRLMQNVRAEGSALYPPRASAARPWWRTERTFRITPLTGLAIAAGVTAVIAISSVEIGSRISAQPRADVRAASNGGRDTVQVVRFVFVDSRARKVELVGDFNEWAKGSTELRPSGAQGVWTVSVPLSPGRHEYAFIINGSRWVADPLAVKSSDDFGTESSVIRVGAATNSAT